MAVLVLKRTSDKLDAVLAGAVLCLGVLVLGVYLSAPRLLCVPAGCVGRPYSTHCARDWLYLRFSLIQNEIKMESLVGLIVIFLSQLGVRGHLPLLPGHQPSLPPPGCRRPLPLSARLPHLLRELGVRRAVQQLQLRLETEE